MMRNIKLTLEYDGTNFSGWQLQTPDKRTVQGEIEKALLKIFKKEIRIIGSGRTDTGVHALGQAANFKIDSPMPLEKIVRALNGNLPDDISVLSAEKVSTGFHAQHSAKQKTYRYSILNRPTRPAIDKNFVLHIPYKINLSAMRKEAKLLVGKHNFVSFMATDTAKRGKLTAKDTTRTVSKLEIHKKEDLITIDIAANGFLYKMVRNIVGTLLDIGTGLIPQGSARNILKAKSRRAARETAPAKGLILLSVKY